MFSMNSPQGLKKSSFKFIVIVLIAILFTLLKSIDILSAMTIYEDVEYTGRAIPIIVDRISIENLTVSSDGEVVFDIRPPENVSFVVFIVKGVRFLKQDATIIDFIRITPTKALEHVKIEIYGLDMPDKAFIRNLICINGIVPNLEVIILNSTVNIDNIVYYEPSKDYYQRYLVLRMYSTSVRSSTKTSLDMLFYSTQKVFMSYFISNSNVLGEYYASKQGTLEMVSVHRRELLNKDNMFDAVGISLTTIILVSLGIYIEHRIRKQEKIEEIFEEGT